MDSRVSWDEYFMNIARVVATRATCDRKHVGAVLVRHKTILSTGYNGSIRGLPHCSESGHMMEDGHCVRTVHAEANAIIQAAKNGVAIEGATIYTTASPCWPCFKVIANSGCSRIVFGEFYRDNRIFEYAQQIGIELVSLDVPARPDLQPTDTGAPQPVTGPKAAAPPRPPAPPPATRSTPKKAPPRRPQAGRSRRAR